MILATPPSLLLNRVQGDARLNRVQGDARLNRVQGDALPCRR